MTLKPINTMSKTIFCTNPMCNATIEVVDTVDSVVCTHCNTWQLVSIADSADGGQSRPDSHSPDPFDAQLPPPPFLPPLEDVPLDSSGDSVIPPNLGYNDNDLASPPLHGNPNESATMPDENQAISIGVLQVSGSDPKPLKLGKNVIGRKGTDIEINDRTISRKHCVLEVVKNEAGQLDYFIYDIGHDEDKPSTNGVFIGGRSQRLQDFERIKLFNGSVITIGNVHLVLTT